ncbi:hypothetical protein SPFL3102_00352 [Sporomusaceae bacterium FL31]|nr:hypothetical protein SPFL3101_01844 [Sporomusaceae bacterium FL31]GCE32566.1 hypothetical protein SPFL3102_00352 [Sporomusaceae bacterium]
MSQVLFPSCKAQATYRNASERLSKYLQEKHGMKPIGCCRVKHQQLTPDDTAIVVCNNCAAILEESSQAKAIQFIWELIDADERFQFPDYHGAVMTIQDCWIAFEKRHVQETVRSLLSKMNIQYLELEENYNKTRFCGTNLLSPCTESNAKLAHRRYVVEGAHMFTPCTPEEQGEHFRRHCEKIKTARVVCYCKFCTEAINLGEKKGIHMLELLFPNEK